MAFGYASSLGQGVCDRGVARADPRGFTGFGVQCVVADTVAGNTASRRVLEKAGLRLVGTSQQPCPYPVEGGESGDVEYALRKADWEQPD